MATVVNNIPDEKADVSEKAPEITPWAVERAGPGYMPKSWHYGTAHKMGKRAVMSRLPMGDFWEVIVPRDTSVTSVPFATASGIDYFVRVYKDSKGDLYIRTYTANEAADDDTPVTHSHPTDWDELEIRLTLWGNHPNIPVPKTPETDKIEIPFSTNAALGHDFKVPAACIIPIGGSIMFHITKYRVRNGKAGTTKVRDTAMLKELQALIDKRDAANKIEDDAREAAVIAGLADAAAATTEPDGENKEVVEKADVEQPETPYDRKQDKWVIHLVD